MTEYRKLIVWLALLSLVANIAAIYPPPSPPILDGDIQPLMRGMTRMIIDYATRGKVGTIVLKNGSGIFYAYGMPQGYGFVISTLKEDAKAAKDLAGQIASYKTVKELIEYLKSLGWQPVVKEFLRGGDALVMFGFVGVMPEDVLSKYQAEVVQQ